MRVRGWRKIVLWGLTLGLVLMVSGCGPGKSATQTAVAQTAVQQTAEEATRIAPTNTPTPTLTPTPTSTPSPTPTQIKESVLDLEGDCEAISGNLADEGCQVDIQLFEVLPCENPGFTTFQVGFYRMADSLKTDICFLINADGDPATGFENEGFLGVDWDYCWTPETSTVLIHTFDALGTLIETIIVANPYRYVSANPGGDVRWEPFWMTFPPAEFRENPIAANAETVAQGLYYGEDGTMVFDGTHPILLSSCPVTE